MAWRSYIAPPDDPNGNAGKLIWTDDQGHFQVGGNNPEGPTGGANATPAGSGANGLGDSAADVLKLQLAAAQANQAAQIAYNNAVLDLQRQNAGHQWGFQQEQLAQAAAHDAWQKSVAESGVDVQRLLAHVQEGVLTGTYNGAPTLAAQEASGYLANQAGSVSDRVTQAYIQARDQAAANHQPFDGAATRSYLWQTIGGLSAQAAQQMNRTADEYFQRTGQPMPADLADQQVKALGGDVGTPTLAREQMQNTTGLGLLDLASRLRGPDNAFAYANTLASVPDSMRGALNAMMQRSGITYTGPNTSGLAGVAGQIGAGNINGQANPTAGMMVYDRSAAQAAAPNGTPPTGMPQQQPTGGGQMGAGDDLGQMVRDPVTGTTTHAAAALPTYTGPGAQSAQPATATSQPNTPQHLYQYSPTDWNNTNPYIKKLMLAGLENQGNDKQAEQDQYQMALPRYTGPSSGRIAA